jgi:Phosphotransferase enzyme family
MGYAPVVENGRQAFAMMTDRGEIETDHAMKALDPMTVTEVIRKYLPASLAEGITIRDRDIKLIQSQGATLRFRYHLHREAPSNDVRLPHYLYGKIYRKGSDHQLAARPLVSLCAAPPGETNRPAYLPELDMWIWLFPSDPTLSQLSYLCDTDRVTGLIPDRGIRQDIEDKRCTSTLTIDPISYHPENRCTIRYTVQRDRQSDRPSVIIYGKTFNDDRGRDVYGLLKTLWQWSQEEPEAFVIPYPYTYDETVKTIWQQGLTGKPLLAIITPDNYRDYVCNAATSLAHLHRSSLSLPPSPALNLRLNLLKEQALHIAHTLPTVKEALISLVKDLDPLPIELAQSLRTPVHGSFRLDEILSCNGKLGLSDFDNCCIGDPFEDCAYFLTDLHFCSLDPVLLKQVAATFYQTYQSQRDSALSVDHLTWHYQFRLLQKIRWIYQKQSVKPGAERRMLKVLGLAKQAPAFIAALGNAGPSRSDRSC